MITLTPNGYGWRAECDTCHDSNSLRPHDFADTHQCQKLVDA